MKILSPIGRIVFALPFLMFGLNHFMYTDMMATMVPIPGGAIWVYITGAAMLAGAVALIANKLTQWAAIGFAALMLVYVLTLHLPGVMNATDPQSGAMSMISMLKDLIIMGGALFIAGASAQENA